MNKPDPRHPVNGLQAAMHAAADAVAESNHRIANSPTIAAAFLRLQRRQAQSDDVKDSQLSAGARLSSIAKVHAYLQQQGAAEPIPADGYLHSLLREIDHAIGTIAACLPARQAALVCRIIWRCSWPSS